MNLLLIISRRRKECTAVLRCWLRHRQICLSCHSSLFPKKHGDKMYTVCQSARYCIPKRQHLNEHIAILTKFFVSGIHIFIFMELSTIKMAKLYSSSYWMFDDSIGTEQFSAKFWNNGTNLTSKSGNYLMLELLLSNLKGILEKHSISVKT